jgi:hypothetical protein
MAVTLATILVLAGISYSYFSGALDHWLESLAGPVDVAPASVVSGDEVVYRPEDVRGASGLHRVGEELADRASALVQPSQVSAILFREIMIQ